MKRYFIVIFFIISCSDKNEREDIDFQIIIKNESGVNMDIAGYDTNNNKVFEDQILNMETNDDCTYSSEVFLGMLCGVDSLVFKFENDMGYICTLRENNLSLCFENKTPFGASNAFNSLENNIYEFIVNQQDFANANDLLN